MDTAAESTHPESSAIPEAALRGRIRVRQLLNGLLDLPTDAAYEIAMRESQSHPVEVECYHSLAVEGNVLWVSSRSTRQSGEQITEWQDCNQLALFAIERGTVRSLINRIAALDPDQTIDLGGHFHSDLLIRSYPLQCWRGQ